MKKIHWILWAACVFCLPAHADNVLIIHGLSTSSETGTTQAGMDNWPVVCNAQGQHTITYADTPPASLSGYQQIWDTRFTDSSPLTAGDMTAYAAALSSGASLFVMGENSSFMTRNNSLFQFVDQVGGGQLIFDSNAGSTQTVHAPLDANGLTSITFLASGNASAVGLTGTMATVADNTGTSGSTFVWPRGTLTSAPAGKLTMVLDVNFMMPGYSSNGNGRLFANLCEFMAVPPAASAPVPALGAWGLAALAGLLGVAATRRRRPS